MVGQPPEREAVDLKASADAFSAFYASEYRNVVALAYALTGRAAVAEELAQDAFLVAHRNWARVSAYDVPGAFVRRVVSNMAVSFTRRLAAEARALARLAARSPEVVDPARADGRRLLALRPVASPPASTGAGVALSGGPTR